MEAYQALYLRNEELDDKTDYDLLQTAYDLFETALGL